MRRGRKASHRTFLELEFFALCSVLPENEVLSCKELESASYRFHCTESMFCVMRHFRPCPCRLQAASTRWAALGFAVPKWS